MTEHEKRVVEDNRALRLALLIIAVGVILSVIISAWPCRADSTKVFQGPGLTNTQIADSRPKLREKWLVALRDSMAVHKSRNDMLDSLLAHIRFERGWIVIDCPVKFGNDSEYVMLGFGGMSAQKAKITVKQPPINIPVVRARGLDSTFNVKEKVWYYYDWSNGKRVNMRSVK